MKESNQEEFINRVKAALEKPLAESRQKADLFSGDMPVETRVILERVKSRTAEGRKMLLETLIKAAEPINLKVIPVNDTGAVATAIAELVRDKDPEWGDPKSVVAWQHPLIESLNLPDALSEQGVPVVFADFKKIDAEGLRQRISESYIGITSADFCMADTATLVMRTRAGQARSVSLLPSIHVAVIEIDRVIADLKELYALLKWDPQESQEGLTNCMTLISGPSKTADIEATMVHGAHGPREVYTFVITPEY
ncbi:MAG: lactate utilization protein [Deltaproteobacteria bacterium]|jgi:L-lactate dehydrogenase complex protein LldG